MIQAHLAEKKRCCSTGVEALASLLVQPRLQHHLRKARSISSGRWSPCLWPKKQANVKMHVANQSLTAVRTCLKHSAQGSFACPSNRSVQINIAPETFAFAFLRAHLAARASTNRGMQVRGREPTVFLFFCCGSLRCAFGLSHDGLVLLVACHPVIV